MEYISKILVVDDEESDRAAVAQVLRREGYHVIEAETYTDAVAAAGADTGISFLVADVALPDGNGCSLALALRQRIPELRVLFVSGHVGSEVCQYYGLDVTDLHFLRKPFEEPELAARVRRVMAADVAFPELYVPKTWTSSGQ